MPTLYEGLIQSLDRTWIVGRYSARRRHPFPEELRVMARLLETVSKQHPQQREVDPMATRKAERKQETQDACNMVFLAGEIRSKISINGKRGFFMIDGGEGSEWVACTVFDETLAKSIQEYDKGDYIKVVGFVNVWSVKENGQYVKDDRGYNIKNTEIRITQIKSKPPENRHPRRDVVTDDDIPF